jgi:hypothetical protein
LTDVLDLTREVADVAETTERAIYGAVKRGTRYARRAKSEPEPPLAELTSHRAAVVTGWFVHGRNAIPTRWSLF